ncbi:Aspyridones efflux apdF [Hyphodiscus hymeniophilus]|uniref:Aspyridones efflux apdF n=1 Tax=Hyphodiscus hymeniophilus TaxID=353542 RepID=A0A9P6VDH4_9HELO|nr:Aspyridones efflux apdF [Hyphodiscus hymeniophilus]
MRISWLAFKSLGRGIANTYGAFQTYYQGALLEDQSSSRISWIGSIQAFMLNFAGGFLTGPIYDAGYMRELIYVGTVTAVFGMMMTSICKEYWQFILAQGLTVGVGAGCLLLPSVAVMPAYFKTRRALATGIGASGSSIGLCHSRGIIYPIVFHRLQPVIGFGWATRVIAFIMLATLAIPITVMRAKNFPSTRRPFIDTKVLREVPYVLFTFGEFCGFAGLYLPFFYIQTYAISKSIVSPNLGFYMLSFVNAGSFFGRIVPNFFSDRIGPLNVIMPFSILCGIIAFSWTSIQSTGSLIIFCISYGFFSGTFVSITGPALATLSPDLALVGTHMGMSFAFSAMGVLIGNPVAGVLLDSAGWIGPAAFCGSANVLAGLFIAAARWWKVGWKVWVKV